MTGKMIVFYCAFGESLRQGSAGRPGLVTTRHVEGGMAAWLTAGDKAG